VQDELFGFSGRIGTARVDLLNRVFSTYLIGFLMRATKQERKSALKMIEVLCLSKCPRQCILQLSGTIMQYMKTFSCLEVVSTVTEVGTKGLIHGLLKQTQLCVSFIAPW